MKPGGALWASAALLSLLLSGLAVAMVSPSARGLSLPLGTGLAEYFASPGEFLWWSTLGGAFAGYPTGLSGHVIWVLGTAAFWFLAASPFIAVATHFRSRSRQGTPRSPANRSDS